MLDFFNFALSQITALSMSYAVIQLGRGKSLSSIHLRMLFPEKKQTGSGCFPALFSVQFNLN
jgi:hypothetical protein